MTDYTKLRELAQNATPGPWEAYDPGDGTRKLYADNPSSDADTRLAVGRDGYSADIRNEDAEFIAAADPTVVLALLDELRELRAHIPREQYEADIKAAKADGWDDAIAYSSITEAEADGNRAENPYRGEPANDSESGE